MLRQDQVSTTDTAPGPGARSTGTYTPNTSGGQKNTAEHKLDRDGADGGIWLMCTWPLLPFTAHSDHRICLSSPRERGDRVVTILGREMGSNVKPEE